MLDSLRLWPHIRARIESGPLGPHVAPYLEVLREEGYAPTVVRRRLRDIDHFGRWMSRQRLRPEAIDQATLDRFAGRFRRLRSPSRPRGRTPEVVGGVLHFAAFLRTRGVVPCVATARATTAKDRFLCTYREYLDSVKGVSSGTQNIYLRYAGTFIETMFGSAEPEWSRVGADDVAEFVRIQAAKLVPSACRAPVAATRALLRYLALTGGLGAELCGAVPTVRQWKHAALPAAVSAAEVERVLSACGDGSPVLRRDRAILLLLARLGLRASEVAGLRLDEVDWRQGRVVVRAQKSDRPRVLPLPQDVGEALACYLRGRPSGGCAEEVLFLRCLSPRGPLSAAAVSTIAHRALRRAGVVAKHSGSHVFRHSVATRMVCGGASFQEVAEVLGHARLETTAIYAKLDLATLHRVALPWPGGA